MSRAVLATALALLAAAPAFAADDVPVAVRADLVHTMSLAGSIRDGVVLIRHGKIEEVGRVDEVRIPELTRVLGARVVTPGLIDAHTTVGLSGAYNVLADRDADERSGPNQAALRAIDGFNPDEPLLRWILEHGVTTVQTGPGEANPIGGLAGIFKTHGRSAEEMTVRFPSALILNLGEAPKQSYGKDGKLPTTRMGTAAVVRKAFVEAAAYGQRLEAGNKRGFRLPLISGKPNEGAPPRDLAKEALGLALSGEIPALFTARREDDLQTALRIAEEFKLRVQLADAVEAYLMVDEIRSRGIPVLVGPVMERPGRLETMNQSFETAAILRAAGAPIAFQSGYESYVPRARVVLFEAAVAVAFGLDAADALAALSIEAARILGVDERIGSLEPGKDADLVLFDGDPFEYTTHVEAVLIEGEVAYDRGRDAPPLTSSARAGASPR